MKLKFELITLFVLKSGADFNDKFGKYRTILSFFYDYIQR